MSETWTIGRLLQWTADFLKKQGSDTPRLDAEVLLAHCRNCQRIMLYTAFDEVASDELRNQYRELVKQRAAGRPVAYLVGKREFYSLPFLVTPDVLIPRPETEFLVVKALDILKERSAALAESGQPGEPAAVADVGTGSGIIAITIAKHAPPLMLNGIRAPGADVTAIDNSPAALEIARQNAASLGVAERVTFVEGDLLAGFDDRPRWDLVLSNPPYISEPEYAALDKTVRDYEPRGALVGGPTGTEIISRLIPQAAAQLKPGGWFLCEISPMIEEAVLELLRQEPSLETQPTVKDLAQLARVVVARKG
ncbi:MAG: peptide chain release factor N(5)-glutamine methyltransferase [Pirellulales bacterium]|nr:peptide chain release factor N(5)-glutamine methyltransferase [Pirellulales bacterium]